MGKKTKDRDCPAAGHPISSAECGEGRQTVFACPEQCPFNPFATANYEAFGVLERAVDEKFFNWTVEHVENRAQFEHGLKKLLGEAPNAAYYDYLAWHGIYRLGPDGETCIGHWAKAGYPGLTADERTLLRGKLQMRPAVLEAHRILDSKRVEVVDLLDRERRPFLIVDRGFAAQAVRFGVYAVHLLPLPHYARIFGTCIAFPSLHPLEAEEIINETICHLGGPGDETGMRRWLMEHYQRFHDALLAVSLARRRGMFDSLDAQFGRAVYELTKPFAECRERLDSVPEIADDTLAEPELKEGFVEARVWFGKAGDPGVSSVGEGSTLGRILLGQTHWRLDAMGAAQLAEFRQGFEAWMEDRVRFAGERRDDLGARLRAQEPAYDSSLVPPALLRDLPRIVTNVSRVPVPEGALSAEDIEADYTHQNDQRFLDDHIPALDGKTPLEAAAEPALRQKLLRLMKHWVHESDRQTLETGRPHDVTWMLRELGLNEILFEPPPPRPALGRPSSWLDEEQEEEMFSELTPPPPLPPWPWTDAEVAERLEQALAAFPALTDTLQYLIDLDYPLFDDLKEAVGNLLEPYELQFLMPFVALLVTCFAPPGTQPPELGYEELLAEFRRQVAGLPELLPDTSGSKSLGWMQESSQPVLLVKVVALVVTLSEGAPRKIRPRESSRFSMLIVLKVVINELDRAMRAIPY